MRSLRRERDIYWFWFFGQKHIREEGHVLDLWPVTFRLSASISSSAYKVTDPPRDNPAHAWLTECRSEFGLVSRLWRHSNTTGYNKMLLLTQSACFFLVGCLTFQQHAIVSQGRICVDKFTCCHTEIEVPDPIFYLTQSQYTDTGPTSPSANPITPGAWQGSHWSASF